jgi:hypothetical protein
VTPGEGRHAGGDLLAAPIGQLAAAVRTVVEVEGPIHEAELAARVAGFWGTRVGVRIQARIAEACQAAVRDGAVVRRGSFLWSPGAVVRPRSRSTVRMAADRIAAEEYAATVRVVLATGHGFSRSHLTTEVRAVLGFSRTGALLDEAIGGAVDALIANGEVGESSVGLRLRTGAASALGSDRPPTAYPAPPGDRHVPGARAHNPSGRGWAYQEGYQ